ncbi:MAG: hypothetical protein HKN57_04750 [Xanthomonadales bacterium]|nr:hypothetical protein [Gammaproteobacteria bacterium]NND56540.1 hypothetical protein [Xanthomonadales bacterium]NNK52561.1 hypothetical protein [Xanthomonadales bacterium]
MLKIVWSALLVLPTLLHAGDRYHVVFSKNLDTVSVEACYDGAPPEYLYRSDEAEPFVDYLLANGQPFDPPHRYGRMRVPELPVNSCLKWQVDLGRAAEALSHRLALSAGDSYLSNGNLWFWRDDKRRNIQIDVELPPGAALSAPWQQLPQDPDSDGTFLSFRPAATPASWTSRIAVGTFRVREIPVADSHLRLAVIGEVSEQQQQRFAQWIGETAVSVGAVYGKFPQPEAQVLVVPVGPQREVVPWAHVIRGGGPAVEFFVDETLDLSSLREDWTATHEFSHLLLPAVSSADRWLSEGLASYYQSVLRARDGRLSEREAWQKLHGGFQRGQAATRDGVDLAAATRGGWGNVMRVYWSGAAMMLKADTQLRMRSSGRQSLDSALANLQACCFDPGRSWSARELFAELDRLTGYHVFSNLYREHVPDENFPDVGPVYDYLGLVAETGMVSLDHRAPGSRIRTSIMRLEEQLQYD